MYTFDSHYTVGFPLPEFEQDVVKNEPMLFNCDFKFALDNGGPITREWLKAMTDYLGYDMDRPSVIDTRVHMLMPGWYPAIPGFHHDDVPRGPDGQPDYDDPEYRAFHCMALVNGEICPTEFAVGSASYVKPDPKKGPTYKQWHVATEELIENGILRREVVPSNHLIFFDWQSMHQGVAAKKNGWRWFGRATWHTKRKVTNEIRRQVQVYLENPMEGW